ncbi:hypothetical protein Tsubulata_040919 [Turnera subulata]|uniref:Homeobox domain-containing protein n=1 Tax=Turnera subulata TaxID=218843 RepID=A0A9Q0GBD8_9ROSI|nr:hypothetical protein Tsubulata_040919 [Turnera subulata]
MEGGEGGSSAEAEKKPPEVEVKSKRKMKTASQLEILEKTYAVETYPSESIRAELSVQLGLSDRQLQMWFCHRRLKDRKAPQQQAKRSGGGKESPAPAPAAAAAALATDEEMGVGVREGGSEHALRLSPFGQGMDPRRVVGRTPGVAVPRISSDVQAMKRYYEPQQSIAELRAIAFVEAQLGEPLREDGPILGMEFDPLPPYAFGAPIGSTTVRQQKSHGHLFEASLYERPDAKSVKGATRALHEYQFLPQQPTVRAESYERAGPSYQYDSSVDGHNTKSAAFSSIRSFMPANEQVPSGFPSPVPSLSLMPQEGRQSHLSQSAAVEYEDVPRKSSLSISMDAQFGSHPITSLENPFLSSDRRAAHDEEVLRMERKRKSEEARIAREVEAHEKRIRKELEKQDILRRKREEQMKKEMERLDRERRKEEERLLREKQREEERYQREQRRELERREKFLQKQSIRAEKMRQKEELRREREVARQKAATERAMARRIAKESMELVDDERLELVELAASSMHLPSVNSLDWETLQNLDMFRDKLTMFPPQSVHLKKPFSVQPWKDSEENVGNLLMVWRFLITFGDVLGIWPFTLDEFVQALHDYDSRLLGEIHVAMLRSIIKDIEDVARTPATGLGGTQNSTANPGGGHPQIVEGAYAWGFDIRSWQRHLNPLTWPEILRQFGLSAGLGPQLRKKNADQGYLYDENEGKDGKDVIANLRNGVAVENAVAIMHERGFSNQRRSRHRLTPGTVKFAAFHVLSLEGSQGLTILEVADKIQKSGLRDLTTSKTPEASIAAALSRDSKLFERTAPSTYCVRSVYRKDPADAEAILSAARERIRVFKSGFADGEDADDAEKDEDAEREEDSESDAAEDPEMDELATELDPEQQILNPPSTSEFRAQSLSENGKQSDSVNGTPQVSHNGDGGLSSLHSESINNAKGTGASIDLSVDDSGVQKETVDIDESKLGERWVQGLMEGEYSELSVEERLNALVSLIGVAIEGNSVRVVLEERLEAANALKKRMWSEAQLDKRRVGKEFIEFVASVTGTKMESNVAVSAPESRQSPLGCIDDKSNEVSVNAVQERSSVLPFDMNYGNNISTGANLQVQDLSTGLDILPYQQQGYAAERPRSQLKSLIGHKAEQIYVYRSLPLGQDRRRNRYWQFVASASHNDPGSGRIFVELHDGRWRLIDSQEDFYALLASLDTRGVRESHLHAMLQKIEGSFKGNLQGNMLHAKTERQGGGNVKPEAVEITAGTDCSANIDCSNSTAHFLDSDTPETSTSFTIELGRNEYERNYALKRHQEFQKWMWKECFSPLVLNALKFGKKRCRELLAVCDFCSDIYLVEENYCHSCHKTCDVSGRDLNCPENVANCDSKLKKESDSSVCGSLSPPRIRLLKLKLALIEASVSVLSEALQSFWTNGHRKSWGVKLQSSLSAEDLLQNLTLLEAGVKRDYLSANYETTSELLNSSDSYRLSANTSNTAAVPVLPWIPRTVAAVALRVLEFDASVSYKLHQKVESQKDRSPGDSLLPSKNAVGKNGRGNETAGSPHQSGFFQEENWVEVGIGLSGSSRGRGSRSRGRARTPVARSQRRVISSRAESGKRNTATNSGKLGQVLTWKGRPRARGGRKRSRRSLRSRQKAVKNAVESVSGREMSKGIFEGSPGPLARNNWNNDKTRLQVEDAEIASTSSRSEYDDENGLNGGDGYDDLVVDDYAGGFDTKEGSDYNPDANEDDEDDIDEDGEEQGDLDIQDYINGNSDDGGVRDRDGGENGDADDAIGSTSSDYSE